MLIEVSNFRCYKNTVKVDTPLKHCRKTFNSKNKKFAKFVVFILYLHKLKRLPYVNIFFIRVSSKLNSFSSRICFKFVCLVLVLFGGGGFMQDPIHTFKQTTIQEGNCTSSICKLSLVRCKTQRN